VEGHLGGVVFDWKNPLFRFGVCATTLWLLAGIAIVVFAGNWCQAGPPVQCGLKPNEWGDVFAGLFAPVAFLWLVLGFVQQGQELRLQVEELRNTVKHQGELVEVSREQVETQRSQIEHERQQQRLALKPRFVLENNGTSGGPQGVSYDVVISNGGAIATNIFLDMTPAPQQGREKFFASVGPQDLQHATLSYPSAPAQIYITIRYTDAGGNDDRALFTGVVEGTTLRFIEQRSDGLTAGATRAAPANVNPIA
jgi:hypothetical protein